MQEVIQFYWCKRYFCPKLEIIKVLSQDVDPVFLFLDLSIVLTYFLNDHSVTPREGNFYEWNCQFSYLLNKFIL